jgi:hypothetical protein
LHRRRTLEIGELRNHPYSFTPELCITSGSTLRAMANLTQHLLESSAPERRRSNSQQRATELPSYPHVRLPKKACVQSHWFMATHRLASGRCSHATHSDFSRPMSTCSWTSS